MGITVNNTVKMITRNNESAPVRTLVRHLKGLSADTFEHGVKINLTKELTSTFYTPEKIREILAKYPEVSRRVGTLPSELVKKIGSGENLDKFDELLTGFAKNFTAKNGEIAEEEISVLAANLSKVLGETVTIIPIGGGRNGFGYKIATKEKNMFFKCFFDASSKPWKEKAGHGNYAEIASALYSSKKAPDKFVRFYMGKLGEKNDGYMLTEFVEGKNSTQKPKFSFKDLIHKFLSGDPNPANKRNGRFIDFGMCDPTEFDKMDPLSYKILKKIMVALDEHSAKSMKQIADKYKDTPEYNKALEKVKGIILKKFNGNIEEFASRKDLFGTLGLDYRPELKKLVTHQLGKYVPSEDIEKIAQTYGVSVEEIEQIRKPYLDSFMSKFSNNLMMQ